MKNYLEKEWKKAAIGLSLVICILSGVLTTYASYNYKNTWAKVDQSEVIVYNSENNINYGKIDTKVNLSKELYLSDIDPLSAKVGWGQLQKDQAGDGNLITVKIENSNFAFTKGLWAHATSTLVYDLSSYDGFYKYFVAYVGLNATAASSSNGVKFHFYISEDNKTWNEVSVEMPEVALPGANAALVKVPLEGAKYLKLVADSNGANGNDHAVYADAKLVDVDYKETNVVDSIEEYDERIKNYPNKSLDDKEYELLVLQRNFVSKTGRFALKAFVEESEENKQAFNWLFKDVDNLRLYINGGSPIGTYYNSLKVLSDLYKNYKIDFTNATFTKYGTKLGDLYKTMAVALSLTHSSRVALWMAPSAPESQSDAVTRYEIYKNLHANGKFVVTDSIDITKWFENYTVEEMRFVMNNMLDDQSILWLNEYTQSFIDANPSRAWTYLTPHPYMAYVWPNYGNEVFHDPAKKDYWDEKFNGIFSKYGVEYSTPDHKVYKIWMNFRNEFGTGAVCGGISKTGSNIRTSHGIPAAVIGQPGHAAIMYYTQDENGNGYWNIDNDVSGWTLSEKGERILLGWGNTRYGIPNEYNYKLSYLALSQEVINDFDTFQKSSELVFISDSYNDDLAKQEEYLRKALKVQPLDINAWQALIKNYKANENKTPQDYVALADELTKSLKYFPLPMYQLSQLIKMNVTGVEEAQINNLQNKILNEASKTPNNTADSYTVYQPGLTRTMANLLLNKKDTSMAKFSFDGEDAGKIVLASNFDGSGVRWDYNIDGLESNKWTEVSFTPEDEHKWQLSQEEIDRITSENGIIIHIVGTSYDESNLYKIEITKNSEPNIYLNDIENKVIGTTDITEWRLPNSNEWTYFKDCLPDLTGDKTIYVRNAATGTKLKSREVELVFTKDEVNEKQKYVSITRLSVNAYSTQNSATDAATNVIDGRLDNMWHTLYNGSDTNKFITLEVDSAINLSRLDFYPRQDGSANGRVLEAKIEVSLDGENWTTAVESVKWENNATKKTVEFETPIKAKYVRLTGVQTHGSYMSCAQIMLFEDAPKLPTALVKYDITELTNKDVVATIYNLSSGAKVVSEDGALTHTFTENGNFTFIIEDETTGLRNYITANVYNIDKKAPTATIKYSSTTPGPGAVTATLVPSEEVTVTSLGNSFTHVFTENGEFTFTFIDRAGNEGSAKASVIWITDNTEDPVRPDVPGNQGNGSIPIIKPRPGDQTTITIKPDDNTNSEEDKKDPVKEDPKNETKDENKSEDNEAEEENSRKIPTIILELLAIGILVSGIVFFLNRRPNE